LRSKISILSFLFFTAFFINLFLSGREEAATLRAKLIPFNPNLKLEEDLVSPGRAVKLLGSGLILNLDPAYRFRLINLSDESSYWINPESFSVSSKYIELKLDSEIPYGDYAIEFQFKNRYLKSLKQILADTLKIRPEAENLRLLADVLLNTSNLKSLIANPEQKQFFVLLNSLELNQDAGGGLDVDDINSAIRTGSNEIQIYTMDNDFKSILSEPQTFYFLPPEQFKSDLLIQNKPFSVRLEKYFTKETIDITPIIKQETVNNGTYYYLNSVEQARYLIKLVESVALKIESMKVTGDEAASIKNSSLSAFKLKKCKLADSVKIRFEFTQDIDLAAGSNLIINGDLGLNNTGSDYLSLSCEVNKNLGIETITLDQFFYSKTDEAGFAIRE